MRTDVVLQEALFRSWTPGHGWSAHLRAPVAMHVAWTQEEVLPLLALAEAAGRAGRYAAVLVSYEAASACDPALPSQPDETFPLAIVAEFEAHLAAPAPEPGPQHSARQARPVQFRPMLDADAFVTRVEQAQHHIAAGDTYQVNLTFPMVGGAEPDTREWFDRLSQSQQATYAAWLDLGGYHVVTLSPELFFERRGRHVRTRPMKGTSPRGRWREEDTAYGRALAESAKAHAENVMIVDLLRNDLGRVAETGSVQVPALLTLEAYPTVWQLTSTVEATLREDVTLPDLFRALFPCGSVTGAPKVRTMQLISALESGPRGLYTGAVGLVLPGGDCTFSVAIRTLLVDRASGTSVLGVGAGITADSDPRNEYDECVLKAAFVSSQRQWPASFSLIETLRLEDGQILRRDAHLARLRESAAYFSYPFPSAALDDALDSAARQAPHGIWRVRIAVDSSGAVEVKTSEQSATAGPWRVAWANAPVDPGDPFLCHKTTWRDAYDTARRGRPDVDDVLLWNTRGEVTESTIANIVIELDGVKYTPPRTSGLLPGILRTELVHTGAVVERVLTRGLVSRADRLWLVNSLRGWIEASLIR